MVNPRSGGELLVSNEAEAIRKLQQWWMNKATKARHNTVEFFEFVMREEHTQKRIKLAPHQKVMIDFALAHDRSVHMIPADHSKSFTCAGLTLKLLGEDVSARGAIISATQEQAAKPLKMVRDYIESSLELQAVYPHLRRGQRETDVWTQTAITVDRPAGIRDPSLMAVGIGGAIAGSRLKWIIVDDILNFENTATKEQREKTYKWFDSEILSRLDPSGARIVVCNTARHPEDIAHRLEKLGWATLRMQITGDIYVKDDVDRLELGFEPWDSEHLRPRSADPSDPWCRLVAHDPDPTNSKSLWPGRYPLTSTDPKRMTVERLRRRHLPYEFNQLYMQICRDDATARCQLEWIELCKLKARQHKVYGLTSTFKGNGNDLVFTGVDLAVSPGEEHDDTAFFTFYVRPDGLRVILDIEIGQFNGPQIVKKLIEKCKQYNSVVRVENNAAQDYIRQFVLDKDISVPIKPHTTGRVKAHPEHGIAGLFIELYNGAWLIPNDKYGNCNPAVQKWIDACLYYVPTNHTDDVMMACYFGREQAKEWGVLSGADVVQQQGSIGMQIMSR